MAEYVEFDVEKLLGPLNILQKANFNYAAKQTLKIVGFQVAKRYLPAEMVKRFKSAVPYTLRSVNYGVQGQTLTLSVNPDESKGNAPAKYLFGVMSETGAPAYPTRFARWLWDKGFAPRSKFPVPAFDSPAVPLSNKGGTSKVPAWFYSQTQVALARSAGNMVVGKGRKSLPIKGRVAGARVFNIRGDDNRHLYPGIYRVKSTQKIDQLFRYIDTLPMVPPKLPFHSTSLEKARELIPTVLSLQIQKSIAKTR
jgi:hypothetical protein